MVGVKSKSNIDGLPVSPARSTKSISAESPANEIDSSSCSDAEWILVNIHKLPNERLTLTKDLQCNVVESLRAAPNTCSVVECSLVQCRFRDSGIQMYR